MNKYDMGINLFFITEIEENVVKVYSKLKSSFKKSAYEDLCVLILLSLKIIISVLRKWLQLLILYFYFHTNQTSVVKSAPIFD